MPTLTTIILYYKKFQQTIEIKLHALMKNILVKYSYNAAAVVAVTGGGSGVIINIKVIDLKAGSVIILRVEGCIL